MLLNCDAGEDFWESLGCREIKPLNSKEINSEYSLERMMLRLKLQYLATWCKESANWKSPDAGKDWEQEEKGTAEGDG